VKAFPAKDSLQMTTPATLFALSERELASGLRSRVVGSSPSMLPSVSRKSHFGDFPRSAQHQEDVEKLHVEIEYCLKGLHLLEDDLLGSGPKLPGPNSLPRTQSNSLGSRLPRPKSMKSTSPSSTRGPSEPTQLSKGKARLLFPIKRPKIMIKAKADSVLRPIPTPHFSLDAGASTFAVQSESLGLGSAISKSVFRPGFFGQVYQRRKLRNHQSSAIWKVKQGQAKADAETSQSREKDAVSSMVGEEDTSLASEEVLRGGEGEPKVLQLANRQSEELAVTYLGLESDDSRQSGFGSYVARETTDLGEKGSVEKEIIWLCRRMVEIYCWLLRYLVRSCVLYWVILGLVWTWWIRGMKKVVLSW
jgi:hypothetical protein